MPKYILGYENKHQQFVGVVVHYGGELAEVAIDLINWHWGTVKKVVDRGLRHGGLVNLCAISSASVLVSEGVASDMVNQFPGFDTVPGADACYPYMKLRNGNVRFASNLTGNVKEFDLTRNNLNAVEEMSIQE